MRAGSSALSRAVGRYLVPAVVAVLFVAPLPLIVVGSLRPIGAPPPGGLGIIPEDPSFSAYGTLARLLPLPTYLRNSLIVVAIAVPVTVLVASMTGWAVRILPARRRRALVLACLAVLLVPASALWTTRFSVYRLLGATGTVFPLVLPALLGTTPFFALLYAWAYLGIPDSQLEAARLEGAGPWRLWTAIGLPQARTATLAVAVLAFTLHWGNYLEALLYLRDQRDYTLPLGLGLLKLLNPTEYPLLLAGAVVFTVPAVLVFLLAQRVLDDPARALRGGVRRTRASTYPSGPRPMTGGEAAVATLKGTS